MKEKVKAPSRREIGKRSGVRHEGGGVPMSRMGNDPSLYTYIYIYIPG